MTSVGGNAQTCNNKSSIVGLDVSLFVTSHQPATV